MNFEYDGLSSFEDLDLPVFDTYGYNSFEEFQEDNAAVVYGMLFACCELGIKNMLSEVPCLFLDDILLTIKQRDYLEKIELCLQYFEKEEEFEKCEKIIKLKDEFIATRPPQKVN